MPLGHSSSVLNKAQQTPEWSTKSLVPESTTLLHHDPSQVSINIEAARTLHYDFQAPGSHTELLVIRERSESTHHLLGTSPGSSIRAIPRRPIASLHDHGSPVPARFLRGFQPRASPGSSLAAAPLRKTRYHPSYARRTSCLDRVVLDIPGRLAGLVDQGNSSGAWAGYCPQMHKVDGAAPDPRAFWSEVPAVGPGVPAHLLLVVRPVGSCHGGDRCLNCIR